MKLLKQLLKEGIQISGVVLINNKLFYKINTGMKYSIEVHPSRNKCYDVRTLWNDLLVNQSEEVFDSLEEMVNFIFFHCRCGEKCKDVNMTNLVDKYVNPYIKERYK